MTDTASGLAVQDAIESLLSIEDEEALETALEAAGPLLAARAVSAAPSLERKTELLWAMEDRQRRRTLELVPPALVGALVQNLEEDNRYLLGDLSLEQFRALLNLCSPERKFYWITTALSFTDARANALPLLLTTRELVEILMTRAEFEEHVRAIGDYPIEHARVSADLMTDPAQTLVDLLGSEKLLRHFPVPDPALERVLQTMLDYDQDRYVDLIRGGLRESDYAENHPLEWDTLAEDPVLLDRLPDLEAPEDLPEEDEPDLSLRLQEGPPLALVPMGAPALARAAAALPPAHRARVADELQYQYIRQAIAEGGSFHRADLDRVARSVEAYLLLGLRAMSAGHPERETAVLASNPIERISRNGARIVERLRQVALRLQPLEQVFSPVQRAVVRSIASPRLTIGPEGEPRLRLVPTEGLAETADLGEATALLRGVVAWAGIARAVGLERMEQRLRDGGVDAAREELALAALLYFRVELGLVEPADLGRATRTCFCPGAPDLLPEARERLRQVVREWAGGHALDAEAVLAHLEDGLSRIAEKAAAA